MLYVLISVYNLQIVNSYAVSNITVFFCMCNTQLLLLLTANKGTDSYLHQTIRLDIVFNLIL